MKIEIRVPQLPESVSEAVLLNWHKQAGQFVKREECLIDLETDKVVLELPAPEDGALVEIVGKPGDVVITGTPAGVGYARTPPVFMKPGDVCEVEIEHIGTLVNQIVAQP